MTHWPSLFPHVEIPPEATISHVEILPDAISVISNSMVFIHICHAVDLSDFMTLHACTPWTETKKHAKKRSQEIVRTQVDEDI